jgi:hypothetical protein
MEGNTTLRTLKMEKPEKNCQRAGCQRTFKAWGNKKKYCSVTCRVSAFDARHQRFYYKTNAEGLQNVFYVRLGDSDIRAWFLEKEDARKYAASIRRVKRKKGAAVPVTTGVTTLTFNQSTPR